MTFHEARKWASQQLLVAVTESEAAAMAMELCLFVSKLERQDLTGQDRCTLGETNLTELNYLLGRIVQGEPLQYVLGEAWFSGLRLAVTPAVLIPRSETEELVEWVISHCKFPVDSIQIVDAGTGSGCIAIALKKRIRKAQVTGIDMSQEALALAKKNAHALGFEIHFTTGNILDRSLFEAWPFFDILISNPPYIPNKDKAEMEPRVVDQEPAIALFVPDEDPLCFYRALGELLLLKGKDEAQLFCEMNAGLASETASLFQQMGLQTEIKMDMQGLPRMIRIRR